MAGASVLRPAVKFVEIVPTSEAVHDCVDLVIRPAVVVLIVKLAPALDNVPAAVVAVAVDAPVSVISAAALDDVHSADSRHDAVSDPELVAAVVSSSVHDSVPSADAAGVASADVVFISTDVDVVLTLDAVHAGVDVFLRP